MPSTSFAPGRSPLAQAAIWRAVQLVEEDGRLDDGQAMRQAFVAQPDGAGRVRERAWLLGQRLGLQREWQRWRRWAGMVLLVLALGVVLGSWGLARAVLGETREINVVAAFASLLGLHALTLVLWLAGLLLPWPGGAGVAGAALGRWALQLTARLPLDRGPHAVQLARATSDVLVRARLAPWAFGGISHAVWSLSFVLLLAALAMGLSVRAYRLTWETTLLTPEFFVAFVQATGWLPQRLGFALPDAATLLQPALAGADAQRAWAWWLLGCVAIYGLALRLLCALVCWAAWRRGQARLAGLDMADPGVRALLSRFEAMEPAQVVDAEQPGVVTAPVAVRGADAGTRLLLGFELPPEAAWPPFVPPAAVQVQRIDGSQAERAGVLQALAAAPPHRLLVVCHAASSPDRGTARFLGEACGLAVDCGVLLLGARQLGDTARWQDWLQSSALPPLAVLSEPEAAQAWLEAA